MSEFEIADPQYYDRSVVIFMNERFTAAMRSAKLRGLENFTEGVVVDHTAFLPQHFSPELTRSGCSSAAALIADEIAIGPGRRMRVFTE